MPIHKGGSMQGEDGWVVFWDPQKVGGVLVALGHQKGNQKKPHMSMYLPIPWSIHG